VATENNTVYALDEGTGAVRWRVHVATPVTSNLPCGNIDPSGVTGAPVLNPATGDLFVAVLTYLHGTPGHELVVLAASDGRVVREQPFAVPGKNPAAEQQRSALDEEDGNVYIALGGLYGDCNAYWGAIVSVPQSGGTPGYWHVPTQNQAGIWEPGGPDVLPDGDLLFADGNGAGGPGQPFDGSNGVFELSPALHEVGVFGPTNWVQLNQQDLDLGSSAPAVLPGGVAVVVGKQGLAYLLDLAHLGGVGGQLAEAQVCPGSAGQGAYGADAVDGHTVYFPCTSGPVAVQVHGRSLHVLWTASAGGTGVLMVAGSKLFEEDRDGTLYAFDIDNGRVVQEIHLAASGSDFPWVIALDDVLYAPNGSSIEAFSGL